MALWYVLYTKPNCSLSTKMRELLQVMGADYYEEVVDDDNHLIPCVFLEESYIGGYTNLQNHFKKRINKKWRERKKRPLRMKD